MCGIAGYLSKEATTETLALLTLEYMNTLQAHRGPDGKGAFSAFEGRVGLAHQRLSIIDLTTGQQPMTLGPYTVTYNGEIYNYLELRNELGPERFNTTSDTEVILRAYETWGPDCVKKFRGMFAFALWDDVKKKLFIARDRFGIKPFYFINQKDTFYFASEIKTLLPYLEQVQTNLSGLRDYFSFQFCLGQKTLFDQVLKLLPAHCGFVDENLNLNVWKYWEVHYNLDWEHTEKYFIREVQERLEESVRLHIRSDVPVGAYVSGGMDSSIVASMAKEYGKDADFHAFTGKFSLGEAYDESLYSRILAKERGLNLHEIDIRDVDFVNHIKDVVYHLDEPVAGPGSFPQFMTSRLVRDNNIKVVLGGQGGDELFGGYTRYLIAYFEQCVKSAIDGTINNGNFIVTYESIIPNLKSLQQYKPLIQEFWSSGIFDERDKRYFRLINRSNTMDTTVNWSIFNGSSSFDDFSEIYWGDNIGKESYFDSMTHFDFKTLLPALLHVEDRMSMANSVESRVPFLDHPLVELLATIPSNIKFQNGELKRLIKVAFSHLLPDEITNRKDKMGFPVPLKHWMTHSPQVRDFIYDTFNSAQARERQYLSNDFSLDNLISKEGTYSRNIWGLLNLELWQQQFHDRVQPAPARIGEQITLLKV